MCDRNPSIIFRAILGVILLGSFHSVFAANQFWTNTLGGNFTNKTLWMSGTAPGIADSAFFTNNLGRQIDWTVNVTNANAFFNPTVATTYTQAIASSTWFVTNQYIVASNSTAVATVDHISGSLVVTNAAGNAYFINGFKGDGTYILDGGTLVVNNFVSTNLNTSDFTFNSGTMIFTGNGESVITNVGSTFSIGNAAGTVADMHINSGIVTILNTNSHIANAVGSTGIVSVSGSGTIWSNQLISFRNGKGTLYITNGGTVVATSRIVLGSQATANDSELYILDGGKLFTGIASVLGSIGSNSLTVVAGNGSMFTNASQLTTSTSFNQIIVTNGGLVMDTLFQLNGTSNFALVGDGGTWSNSSTMAAAGGFNTITVSNGTAVASGFLISNIGNSSNNTLNVVAGGKAYSSGSSSINGGSNNFINVIGAGSQMTNGGSITIGNAGAYNQLTISNGGFFQNTTARIGLSSTAISNIVFVSDAGTVWSNSSSITVGSAGSYSFLIISNGAKVYSTVGSIASDTNSTGNLVRLTGSDSLWMNSAGIRVGTNSTGLGDGGTLLVLDGATLEANSMTSGLNNSGGITNNQAIFQFTTANPGITNNGNFVITNGTISYRNIDNAPIIHSNQLAGITFQGSNSFMLNNATNAILGSYMFTNGLGSTNYNSLVLMNGNTRWQATNTTIGATAVLLVTNTTASIFGFVTNSGSVKIANSTATFESNIQGSGRISVDATSTLKFATNTVYVTGNITNAGNINLIKSTTYLQANLDGAGGISIDANSHLVFTNITGVTTIAGVISGAGGIEKMGGGTNILTGVNTFTGPVTNTAGTLQVNSASGLGTSSSLVVGGGTLLFNVGFTNTSATVVLNGGIIQEVDTNVSVGALTVSSSSSISLGSGGGIGTLRFASGTNTVGSGGKLTIYGWSWNSALSGGSDDLIFFTNTSFETAQFLDNVTFFGTGGGARVLSSGELVPITPEPMTLLMSWGLSLVFGSRLIRQVVQNKPEK